MLDERLTGVTDGFGCEPQFIDHIAPVWRALPQSVRGTFWTTTGLVDRAILRGIEAPRVVDDVALRRSTSPPRAVVEYGPRALVASIGDTKLARRMGYRRFAFLEHGAGQSYAGQYGRRHRHPSYAGGSDRDDTELFMVPNDAAARMWRESYPSARVEVVGCPRLDDLPSRQLSPMESGPVVAISFHWDAHVAPESGSAIGHYMGALRELTKAFVIIGHAHPKGDWPKRMNAIYQRWGIEFVEEFDDVCRRADVYAVDNSSTLFEFAATGRPVVVLNAPWYRRKVEHGLRFWEAASVGVNVDQPSDLVAGIRDALADEPSRRIDRERALDLVYAYRSGGAERAASAVLGWVGAEQAEVA
jgi:hypothetical protein